MDFVHLLGFDFRIIKSITLLIFTKTKSKTLGYSDYSLIAEWGCTRESLKKKKGCTREDDRRKITSRGNEEGIAWGSKLRRILSFFFFCSVDVFCISFIFQLGDKLIWGWLVTSMHVWFGKYQNKYKSSRF